MPLNILEIAKTADVASWRAAYGFPLHWGQHSEQDRQRILALVSSVAVQVLEQCRHEISTASVHAPDAQIVKDKICSKLRLLAADARHIEGGKNGL